MLQRFHFTLESWMCGEELGQKIEGSESGSVQRLERNCCVEIGVCYFLFAA